MVLSTDHLPVKQREEWLREMIGREFADVEIRPPAEGRLFNETTIFAWEDLRLSSIRSNAITIERLSREPDKISQDVYLAVVLLSGDYSLEQDGRAVALRPGDMAIYDATRPHRIFCPGRFSKLIVSIPRSKLKERVGGVERCSALQIAGDRGAGAVAAAFLQSCAAQARELSAAQFAALSENCMDLLVLALAALGPPASGASFGRATSRARIKHFVARNLDNPELDAAMVAAGTGMSSRYINDVLSDEGVSLMRYVLRLRLEKCRRDLSAHLGAPITEVAFRWGFNDISHFSRSFKQRFGYSPRDYRRIIADRSERAT
jgi:AraC family transcriptional activator of tynA and feaB